MSKKPPPFWQLPPYIASVADPFVENVGVPSLHRRDSLAIFSTMLKRIVEKSADPEASRRLRLSLFKETDIVNIVRVIDLLSECSDFANSAVDLEKPEQFLELLEDWMNRLKNVELGQMILVPGGWSGVLNSGELMHVIERTGYNAYSFITCNPGKGLEYHPNTACDTDETPPKQKHKTCLRINDVPGSRIKDIGFWSTFFSIWVKQCPPSEYHRVEVIYDVLLPWIAEVKLNEKGDQQKRTLSDALSETTNDKFSEWRTPVRSSTSMGTQSIWEAVRYILLSQGFTSGHVKQLSYALSLEFLVKGAQDLISMCKVYPESEKIVRFAEDLGLMFLAEEKKSGVEDFNEILSLFSGPNFIINQKGEDVGVEALKGKVVGLYFSASWCGPCRQFTPLLAKCYESLKEKEKNIEIIFISSDQKESEFKSYFEHMPWLALNFKEKALISKLGKFFQIQGIPTLIFFGEDGKLLSKDGRSLIMQDPEGASFPWTELTKINFPLVAEIIRDSVFDKDGEVVPLKKLEGKVIGLYWSAHWCPPCRGFTPRLINTYNFLKKENKEFEIIFLSADRSEEEYKEYYSSMPWLTLNFSDVHLRRVLDKKFQIRGIPTLVLFDEAGNLLTDQGRNVIMADPEAEKFPWNDISELLEEKEEKPVLTQFDIKFLELGCQKVAFKANKEFKAGRLHSDGLREISEIIDSINSLINFLPKKIPQVASRPTSELADFPPLILLAVVIY